MFIIVITLPSVYVFIRSFYHCYNQILDKKWPKGGLTYFDSWFEEYNLFTKVKAWQNSWWDVAVAAGAGSPLLCLDRS